MEGLSLIHRADHIQKGCRIREEYIEDLIDTYGFVRRDQIQKIYDVLGQVTNVLIDPEKVARQIKHFQNNSHRCWYDPKLKIFFSNRMIVDDEMIASPQFIAMQQCFWLLILFLPQVDYHYPSLGSERVAQIVMHRADRRYLIAYCPPGEEAYMAQRIRDERLMEFNRAANSLENLTDEEKDMLQREKYIMLVHSKDQIPLIQSPDIANFYINIAAANGKAVLRLYQPYLGNKKEM